LKDWAGLGEERQQGRQGRLERWQTEKRERRESNQAKEKEFVRERGQKEQQERGRAEFVQERGQKGGKGAGQARCPKSRTRHQVKREQNIEAGAEAAEPQKKLPLLCGREKRGLRMEKLQKREDGAVHAGRSGRSGRPGPKMLQQQPNRRQMQAGERFEKRPTQAPERSLERAQVEHI